MLPTRAQIEADVIQPTVSVEFFNGSDWVDVSEHVLSTRVHTQLPRAFDLGAGVIPSASIVLSSAVNTHNPAFAPIRVHFGLAGTSTLRRFAGYVTSVSRNEVQTVWEARGVAAAIAAQTIRIPVRRGRPAHTATTSTSIEDPNHPSYAAGMINEVLWRAGGRPLQQQSVFSNALWYYDCTHALLTPEWSWLDAENPWEDIARLCRSVGSLIYQDEQGVVRVRSVIHAHAGSSVYAWTDQPVSFSQRVAQNISNYQSIEEKTDFETVLSAVTVKYIRRTVTGVVECYSDTTARYIPPAHSLPLQLETSEPILRLDRIEVDAASSVSGKAVVLQQTGVQAIAHTVTVTVQNTTNEPVIVTAVRVYANVIQAIEEGSVTESRSSSTVTQRDLRTEMNPYVQNELHARSLARLLIDLYGIQRPVVTLRKCVSDPDRVVGQVVSITSSRLSYTNQRCVIEAIDNDTNSWMDVSVVPTTGLPTVSDFFIVNESLANSTVRAIGY